MKILGNTIIYGKDTLTATPNLQIYNGDSTPSLMWDWRNDGSVFFNQNTLFSFSGNLLTFTGGIVTINQDSGVGTRVDYGIIGGAVASWGSLSHSDHNTSTNYGFAQGSDGSTHINSIEKVVFYDTAVEYARFTGSLVSFFGTSAIGSETISLQGRTLVQGQDTLSTSTAFEIYDGDTIPSLLWDFRNNGDIYADGGDRSIFISGDTLTFDGGVVRHVIDSLSSTGEKVLEIGAKYSGETVGSGSYIDAYNTTNGRVMGRIRSYIFGASNVGWRFYSATGSGVIGSSFLGQDVNSALIGPNVTSRLNTETISFQGDTLLNGYFVQYVSTSATSDSDLINNSISFHISGKQLQGRYKDNGGTVYDLGVGIQYDSSCELSDIDAGSAIIGFCYVIKKKPSGDITVNNIDVLVTSGSSGTVYAGIYDSAGNLLDEGSATVSTTGILTIPLTTGGLQLEGGAEYWYGILEGSGSPKFGSKTVFNNSLIAQSLFVSLTPTGMPATLSGFGSVGTGFYIGVKV